MKIVEKIKAKQSDRMANAPITIAFIGDSVTQGCFECYELPSGGIETEFDVGSAYSTRVRELLNLIYPTVQFNIVNSGISGDNAQGGLSRLARDVLRYSPDLVVVSFGLNDSTRGLQGLQSYVDALSAIFEQLKAARCEVIFLTQNYMNTETSPRLTENALKAAAESFAAIQNSGVLTEYFRAATALAEKEGIPVCDIYRQWQLMNAAGVNTTELLANKLNHPRRELHRYIAIKLVELMLS